MGWFGKSNEEKVKESLKQKPMENIGKSTSGKAIVAPKSQSGPGIGAAIDAIKRRQKLLRDI